MLSEQTEVKRSREFDYTLADFELVCKLIYQRAGISLNHTKQEMVYSRLARRLRALGIANFKFYLEQLQRENCQEWEFFVNALTTNQTEFFREPHHFPLLVEHIRAHHRINDKPVNLWSAATSSGEEAYSMAIAMAELFDTLTPPVRILATDLDTQVLERAQNGVYTLEQIESLSPERKKKFFFKGTGSRKGFVKVRDEIRQLVRFDQLNLLAPDWKLTDHFEAVFCRNVMIYFDKQTQYQVLQKIRKVLDPDGLLFAGHSESFFQAADLFKSCGRTVYKPVKNT